MLKRLTTLSPLILLLGLLIPLSAATTAAAAGPSVWIQNAADRAFYTSTMPAGAATTINLHTAKNEHEAAQILLRAPTNQTNVKVLTPTDLTGPNGATITASNITVTRVANHTGVQIMGGDSEPTPGGAAGHYTDALIENSPVTVPADQTQPYWYSVYVPANQTAGTYTGTVTVQSSLGNVSVPVSVTVYDVTLPPTNQSTFKLNNWFASAGWDYGGTEQSILTQYGVQKYDPNWWKVMENVAKNHAKHRNNVIYADFQALLIPNTTINANGTYNFGWQTFDRFIQLFIDHGALQYIATPTLLDHVDGTDIAGPRPVDILKSNGAGGVQRVQVPINTTESNTYLHTVFAALKQHLDQKGWTDKFYMSAIDEPKSTVQTSESNWLYGIYKQHFTGSSYKTVEAHNVALFGPEHTTLEGNLTSFTPETALYDHYTDFYQNQRIKGKELWLYTAWNPKDRYMNRFMSYHLDKTRLLPWLVWKVGGVGYLHWGWNYWVHHDTFAGTGTDADGDRWLVRPNKAAYDIYDSIRSEAQRDGVEDYELLTKLRATKPVAAQAIANTLITNLTEYTRSGADVVDRHRQILQLLTSTQPDQRFPYSDDFSAGNDQNWVHTVGTWSAATGEYVQTSSSEWNTVSAVKDRAYGDFTMTFDAKIDATNPNGGNTNWIGAVVRSQNATDIGSGYVVALRNNGNLFVLRSGTEIASATVPGYIPNAYTRVKIVAQGNQIKVHAGNSPEPLLSVTDTAFRTGNAALVTGGVTGRFDNVVLNPEINRADGKTAEATSWVTNWGWSRFGAIDGRTASTAAAMGFTTEAVPQVSTQSVTVDLGKSYSLSRVDLWPRNDGVNAGYGFPENFTIQTSPDKVSWTTRITRTGYPRPNGSAQPFTFPSAEARYVKIEGTKHGLEDPSSTAYRMQFAEIQAFGGNLAIGRQATASSSYEGDGWSTRNVTDGSTSSTVFHSMGWSSNNNPTSQHSEDLTVDLGVRTTVNRVDLTPRTDTLIGAFFPTNFVVETSPDAITWTTRRTVTGQAQPTSPDPITYTFPTTTDVRYVRIRSDNGLRSIGSEYRMQLAEIGVHGP